MSFRINTNVPALKAYYALDKVNKQTIDAQLRLASGKRINHVSDDTSGFNVGKSLEGRISVMKAAVNNVSSAKDMLNTAEGSLIAIADLFIRIEGKLSDATNPTSDRAAIASDIRAIAVEVQNSLETAKFNNTLLLTGTGTPGGGPGYGFEFQVGASLDNRINLDYAVDLVSTDKAPFNESLNNLMNSYESSLTDTMTLSSLAGNLATVRSVIADTLGKVGNFVQRLDIKEETLNISIANAQSSFSRLFDADMALEQLNATKGNIIGQAATAMVAQLNTSPGQVLQLFQ